MRGMSTIYRPLCVGVNNVENKGQYSIQVFACSCTAVVYYTSITHIQLVVFCTLYKIEHFQSVFSADEDPDKCCVGVQRRS